MTSPTSTPNGPPAKSSGVTTLELGKFGAWFNPVYEDAVQVGRAVEAGLLLRSRHARPRVDRLLEGHGMRGRHDGSRRLPRATRDGGEDADQARQPRWYIDREECRACSRRQGDEAAARPQTIEQVGLEAPSAVDRAESPVIRVVRLLSVNLDARGQCAITRRVVEPGDRVGATRTARMP
jgi:hypothetical protein